MPIKLKCSCGQVLTVSDAMAGKTGKCPKCQKAIKIPVPAGAKPASDAADKSAAAKPAASKPVAAQPAAAKATAGKPAAGKPAAAKPVAQPVARAAAAKPAQVDELFDEIGLKKKTGPTCPKCGGAISPAATLCTHCGFNLQTGEQAVGFQARSQRDEFTNPYLQEAANFMQADDVTAERHAKAGMPWWMLASFLLGAICIGAAGVVIVDGTMNEPAPVGTFLGTVQRQRFGVVAGVTFQAVGTLIGNFANLSIIIFAFRQSVGKGFAVMLIPLYSLIYGCMTWADNKSGVIGLIVGIVLACAGAALTASAGGIVLYR